MSEPPTSGADLPPRVRELLRAATPLTFRMLRAIEKVTGEPHAAAFLEGHPGAERVRAHMRVLLEAEEPTREEVVEAATLLAGLTHQLHLIPVSEGKAGRYAELFSPGAVLVADGDELLGFAKCFVIEATTDPNLN